jgi:nucleotide-binding universal stress UspA family protein
VAVKRAAYGGAPLPGLVRAAQGAHLAVVGDRGRPPAVRALSGSVTDGLLGAAPCPVAVVRAPESR